LRRVKYHDAHTGKTFNFLTNNFAIPAQTVADLYRYRWQVEIDQPFCLLKSLSGVEKSSDLLRPASWCMAQLA